MASPAYTYCRAPVPVGPGSNVFSVGIGNGWTSLESGRVGARRRLLYVVPISFHRQARLGPARLPGYWIRFSVGGPAGVIGERKSHRRSLAGAGVHSANGARWTGRRALLFS